MPFCCFIFLSDSDGTDPGADWATCSPFVWTKAQVQSWLRWAWDQYNIPGEYDPDKLDLTGTELLFSTIEELKRRSEHGGLLYEAFTQLPSFSQWESKYSIKVIKTLKIVRCLG